MVLFKWQLTVPEDIAVIRNPDASFWTGQKPDGPEVLPPLCPEAQAIEQRHGIKSKQRTAQEKIPAALEKAKAKGGGWQAFHAALADAGIAVRLAGTGLVYVVGGVEIRASHVSRRRCQKPALEQSYGVFEPAPATVSAQAEVAMAGMASEPVDGMPEDLIPGGRATCGSGLHG